MWRELAISRELRVTLAIMVVTLIVFSPAIFAAPGPANTNYLALVMHMLVPTNTPLPTATPTLPPPTYNGCQADPNPSAAPNYPIKFTNINKVAESVTLQNVSTSAIDLTGWQMCSITSNQHHPISGILAAGASQTFVNNGGPIWNNSSPDPGALYNPAGQFVSYFNS